MQEHPTNPLAELKYHASMLRRSPTLVLIQPVGLALGSRYTLGGKPMVLGRSAEADIQVNHPSISRLHARIECRGGRYHVVDLHSMNGTFVNDNPVKERELADSDYLRLGQCIYRFLMPENPEHQYHEESRRALLATAVQKVQAKKVSTTAPTMADFSLDDMD